MRYEVVDKLAKVLFKKHADQQDWEVLDWELMSTSQRLHWRDEAQRKLDSGFAGFNSDWAREMVCDSFTKNKHNHYYKDVSKLQSIDVYRVLSLFNVSDPCIQHATKKLLVAGGRGAGKDITQDIQEAIDSLERWKEMQIES
jgi:hypothetical protein